jgi:hypothetical protein
MSADLDLLPPAVIVSNIDIPHSEVIHGAAPGSAIFSTTAVITMLPGVDSFPQPFYATRGVLINHMVPSVKRCS